MEKHERQISVTAAIKGNGSNISGQSRQPQAQTRPSARQRPSAPQASQLPPSGGFKRNRPSSVSGFQRGCFICGGPHLARVCPDRRTNSEAQGRSSNKSRTAQVTSTPTAVEYTEEELVQMPLEEGRSAASCTI